MAEPMPESTSGFDTAPRRRTPNPGVVDLPRLTVAGPSRDILNDAARPHAVRVRRASPARVFEARVQCRSLQSAIELSLPSRYAGAYEYMVVELREKMTGRKHVVRVGS